MFLTNIINNNTYCGYKLLPAEETYGLQVLTGVTLNSSPHHILNDQCTQIKSGHR